MGGGQVGFNVQSGAFVWGGEIDISYMRLGANFSAVTNIGPCIGCTTWHIDSDLNWLATARAKLGYAAGPVLIYATGGFALGEVDSSIQVECVGCPKFPWAWGSSTKAHLGWTAGGGVEWKITDVISIRGEYLYVDLGQQHHNYQGQAFSGYVPVSPLPTNDKFIYDTDGWKHDMTLHVIRGAVNFKFN
jgi:outer membrane immunogenic protein